MTIQELFNDKTIKAKDKTNILSDIFLQNQVTTDEIISFAKNGKDPVKGTCIEAFEYITKQNVAAGTKEVFEFAIELLTEKAPRVKWEAAKVIGNIAHLHAENLEKAIGHLLENTEHEGTVVRWSAAFALGEILKLKTALNTQLLPALETISERDDKNSIKKIYLDAIKKAKK